MINSNSNQAPTIAVGMMIASSVNTTHLVQVCAFQLTVIRRRLIVVGCASAAVRAGRTAWIERWPYLIATVHRIVRLDRRCPVGEWVLWEDGQYKVNIKSIIHSPVTNDGGGCDGGGRVGACVNIDIGTVVSTSVECTRCTSFPLCGSTSTKFASPSVVRPELALLLPVAATVVIGGLSVTVVLTNTGVGRVRLGVIIAAVESEHIRSI